MVIGRSAFGQRRNAACWENLSRLFPGTLFRLSLAPKKRSVDGCAKRPTAHGPTSRGCASNALREGRRPWRKRLPKAAFSRNGGRRAQRPSACGNLLNAGLLGLGFDGGMRRYNPRLGKFPQQSYSSVHQSGGKDREGCIKKCAGRVEMVDPDCTTFYAFGCTSGRSCAF